jgi:hypothetical protein
MYQLQKASWCFRRGKGGAMMDPVWIGMAMGVAVFVVTIGTVFWLLVRGGSFHRIQQEAIPVLHNPPALHTELLASAQNLPRAPAPFEATGIRIGLRPLDPRRDAADLHVASNGSDL